MLKYGQSWLTIIAFLFKKLVPILLSGLKESKKLLRTEKKEWKKEKFEKEGQKGGKQKKIMQNIIFKSFSWFYNVCKYTMHNLKKIEKLCTCDNSKLFYELTSRRYQSLWSCSPGFKYHANVHACIRNFACMCVCEIQKI